jgi:hypothetical protein
MLLLQTMNEIAAAQNKPLISQFLCKKMKSMYFDPTEETKRKGFYDPGPPVKVKIAKKQIFTRERSSKGLLFTWLLLLLLLLLMLLLLLG